jgi:hypothetical protein
MQAQCTDRFYAIFDHLEKDNVLDIQSATDLWCLHFVYSPVIQLALDTWIDVWDVHGIRTEGYRSPRRLWKLGVKMAERRNLRVEQSREEIMRTRAPYEDVQFPADEAERAQAFEEYCVDDIGRESGPIDKDPHVQVIPPHDLVEPNLHALIASRSFISTLEQLIGGPVNGDDAHTRRQYLQCKAVLENIPPEMASRFIRSG